MFMYLFLIYINHICLFPVFFLTAHVIGHALGMDVPKDELPPPPYPAANPRQSKYTPGEGRAG